MRIRTECDGLALCAAGLVSFAGCTQLSLPLAPHGVRHYETVRADPYHDSAEALRLVRKAHAAVLHADWEAAEALLGDALIAVA